MQPSINARQSSSIRAQQDLFIPCEFLSVGDECHVRAAGDVCFIHCGQAKLRCIDEDIGLLAVFEGDIFDSGSPPPPFPHPPHKPHSPHKPHPSHLPYCQVFWRFKARYKASEPTSPSLAPKYVILGVFSQIAISQRFMRVLAKIAAPIALRDLAIRYLSQRDTIAMTLRYHSYRSAIP